MMSYICIKFRENILNRFKVTEWTGFPFLYLYGGHNSVKNDMWSYSSYILYISSDIRYIYTKFWVNFLNGFIVIERA